MNKFTIIFENENSYNSDELNESWLATFGEWIKWFVKNSKLNENKNIKLKGTKSQIDAFINALKEERKFFLLAQKEGFVSKSLIEQEKKTIEAVKKFEQETNIPWPIE